MIKKINNAKSLGFLIAALLVILITSAYFLLPAQVVEYEMDVKVQKQNKVGFNIDTDAIHFGIVPGGSFARRTVLIENGQGVRFVQIATKGDLADWVSVSENYFTLDSYENKSIDFQVNVPRGTAQGNYTGTAKVSFYRR